jgi:hypothetical protein
VTFTDPQWAGGAPEVTFIDLEDGTHEEEEVAWRYECRVQTVWERRAPGITDYYL